MLSLKIKIKNVTRFLHLKIKNRSFSHFFGHTHKIACIQKGSRNIFFFIYLSRYRDFKVNSLVLR